MGLAIPQVITNRSGAQIIDGSLKFDQGKTQHLTRTPSSDGNKRTWTWSGWVKPAADALGDASGSALFAAYSDSNFRDVLRFGGSSTDAVNFQHRRSGTNYGGYTDAKLRDYGGSGWYHIVLVWDDGATIYVNGVEQSLSGESGGLTDTGVGQINNDRIHYIGARSSAGSAESGWDGQMSQIYFLDGQALEPTEFGFTDPLTNTWKPKKFIPTKINDGTTWSSNVTGNIYGGSAANVFDGEPYADRAEINSSDANDNHFTLSSMSVTASKVGVFVSNSGNNVEVSVNGSVVGTISSGDIDSSSKLFSFTFTETTVTSIKVRRVGSTSGWYLYGINLNDVLLLNGDTSNMGLNGFYLPFDGNFPIGQDRSGRGNDWTPVNFGGSVALDNPLVSGARPILNTTQGGSQAGVSVFGSKQNVGYAVTVYNDGGGNKYYIDGVKQDTVTGLIRGATYTFDTSDSTVSSHPFRFSATSNGSHGGGSEYTNGVAAITGAATTITVPYNAPNTLYYYCTSHSGMGADITGITTNEKLADQYASNCTLALPLVGGDDDVCASIACTARNKTATNSSVTAATTQSNFYSGSHYWSANSDTLQYAEQGDELVFGTGDYTIEFWFYDDSGHTGSGGRNYLFDNRIGGSVVGDPPTIAGWIDGSNEINFYSSDGSIAHSVATTDNRWIHYAAVRSSGETTLYLDGISVGTFSGSTNYTNNGIGVGRATDSGYGMAGYIQDFRIYKVAKYTSNFVVPATKPDILPDTPSGVSGGSKLTKITDGAVTGFDSNSDYLSIPGSNDFVFDGDHTIEMFIYHNSLSDDSVPWSTGGSGTADQFYINTVGAFYYAYGQTGNINSPNGTIVTGKWQHIAVSKQSTNLRMFVDGKIVASSTNHSSSIGRSSNDARIGNRIDGGNAVRGFISNVRIVKGTALYTKNFTPPTAPLTNVTNTKLLCCQKPTTAPIGFTTITATGALPIYNTNDTGITTATGTRSDDDSSSIVLALPLLNNSNDVHADIKGSGSNKTITENGNVTSSSAQSQYYGGSYIFDGNADYLTIPASSDFDFGTGAYTIEMWFRTTSDAGWLFYDAGSSNQGMRLCIGNNGSDSSNAGKLQFNEQVNNGDDPQNGTSLVNDGNWHHVAVCRGSSGDTTKMYVDGILEVTGSANRNFDNNNTVYIGQRSDGTGSDFNGYLQDIRVYKGVAKYTSNFTPVGTFTRNQFAVSPGTIEANGDAAATNFNPFNTDINTVRGQESGYCTFNPLQKSSEITLSNGNLDLSSSSSSNKCKVFGTFSVSSGKCYYEVTIGTNYRGSFGWATTQDSNLAQQPGDSSGDYALTFDGSKISSGSYTSGYGSSFAAGTVIGVRLDADAGNIAFSIDGKDLGNAFTGQTGKTFYPIAGDASSGGTIDASVNFGQKPFKFAPPDGFQPLNIAATRPETVISRPDQYVGVTTYTGDGNSSGRRINIGFRPDLIWLKSRGSGNHGLYDSVRGPDKRLQADNAAAEDTVVFPGASNFGFDFGSETYYNASSTNYVAWTWKAGGNKNTFNVDGVGYATAAAAGLTAGSVTPTGASVGTKQGFSIIKWTAPDPQDNSATIPHGLTQKPDLWAIKSLDGARDWLVYTEQVDGSLDFTHFNNTDAKANSSATAPTATTFGVYGNDINTAGEDQIAYLWHDVPGLQKFGRYEGNTTTTAFIETGFRPAIIWIKAVDQTWYWNCQDAERSPINPSKGNFVQFNISGAEGVASGNNNLDILSNGFKIRSTTSSSEPTNVNGQTYIYGAWAEAPSIDLFGGGANAR